MQKIFEDGFLPLHVIPFPVSPALQVQMMGEVSAKPDSIQVALVSHMLAEVWHLSKTDNSTKG